MMDVRTDESGTEVKLNATGDYMPGPRDGPSVNVVQANIGCCGDDKMDDGKMPPSTNTTSSA